MNKNISELFIRYANRIAETVQYTKWPDDFARSEVKESTMNLISAIRKEVDFEYLTKEDAVELGFKIWNRDRVGKDLYLIPLYLLPIIPIGTEIVSILDDEHIIYDGKNMNNDNRCGYLAYGIEFDKE